MDKQPWWKGPNGEWYVVIQMLLFGPVAFAPTSLPGWPAWARVQTNPFSLLN